MNGEAMSLNVMTSVSPVALSFNSDYSFNATTPNWATKRAYAHFGIGAYGVNG